jgi:peroxiredoxin Q/BCP
LARFRDAYAGFVSRGAELLAVGPDAPEPFQRYWAREHIPFIGMPDPDHRVAKIYKQEINLFKFGRMPMNCIIDTKGNIRYIHYSTTRLDYPDTEIFFNVIDELNKASN